MAAAQVAAEAVVAWKGWVPTKNFLLRPGEYCAGGTNTVTTPFNLRYIQFFVGTQPFQATTASATTCAAATFVSLLFTTQKIGRAHV